MENAIDTWRRERPADEWAAWVARRQKRALTDAEAALVGVVCDAFRLGPWSLSWGSLRGLEEGWHAQVALPRDLSSFDDGALTRLVFAAHDACCRVSVQHCSPTHLRVCLWLRYSRDGQLSSRHPTLEQAVEQWRDGYPVRDEAWIERDACCASLREAKAALDRDRGALLQIFGATPPAPLDTFDGNIANHVINVMLTLLAERDEARAELARLRDGGEE